MYIPFWKLGLQLLMTKKPSPWVIFDERNDEANGETRPLHNPDFGQSLPRCGDSFCVSRHDYAMIELFCPPLIKVKASVSSSTSAGISKGSKVVSDLLQSFVSDYNANHNASAINTTLDRIARLFESSDNFPIHVVLLLGFIHYF